MARTIRLNTSTGAAAGGAAGLSTADVERVVEDKARWILDYEKDYGNDIPTGWIPLIPTVDFDNCFSYKCRDPRFWAFERHNKDGYKAYKRRRPNIRDPVITAARAFTCVSGAATLLELIHRLTVGSTSQLATYDSVGTGGAQNMKEFTFFLIEATRLIRDVVIFI